MQKIITTITSLVLVFVLAEACYSFWGSNPKLESKHISKDLINKKVNNWTFAESDFMGIKILDVKYDNDKAVAYIYFRAIDNKGKSGREGKLRLEYEYAADDWNLINIKSISVAHLHEDSKKSKYLANRILQLKSYTNPLYFYAAIGDLDRLKMEIANGANVNEKEGKKGIVPLGIAAGFGDIDIAKALLENNADVDATDNNGGSPLHVASLRGHTAMVEYLIAHEVKIDVISKRGFTPLTIASSMGHIEIVDILIRNGAKLNYRNKYQPTALSKACSANHFEIVKLLISKGADVSGKPIISAVQVGNIEMIKLLLSHGADINTDGGVGWRPIHLAVTSEKRMKLVPFLIKNGADLTVKTDDQETPLDIAERIKAPGTREVAKMLRKAGSKNEGAKLNK